MPAHFRSQLPLEHASVYSTCSQWPDRMPNSLTNMIDFGDSKHFKF